MTRSKPNPEFAPGAVRIDQDLGTSVDYVNRLGFKICLHWDGSPAVSESDAYAIRHRLQRESDESIARWAEETAADQRATRDEEQAVLARQRQKAEPADIQNRWTSEPDADGVHWIRAGH